jgi:hypothetical protein
VAVCSLTLVKQTATFSPWLTFYKKVQTLFAPFNAEAYQILQLVGMIYDCQNRCYFAQKTIVEIYTEIKVMY